MLKTTELTLSVSSTSYSFKPKQYLGFKVENQQFCSIVVKHGLGGDSDLKKDDLFTNVWCE